MGFSFFAETGAANAPAADAAWEGAIDGARIFAFEVFSEADFSSGFSEKTFLALGHQAFGGTIDKAEAVIFVEGENSDVELAHNGANEGEGFHGAETLLAEAFAQRVDFDHHFAERVVAASAARANGVIFVAKAAENVGET